MAANNALHKQENKMRKVIPKNKDHLTALEILIYLFVGAAIYTALQTLNLI